MVKQIDNQVTLYRYLTEHLQLDIPTKLPTSISCPLHKDNKPSLRLYSPDNRGGYCFSCGKSYNAISMHQAYYSLTFNETLNQLVELFNLTDLKTATHNEIKLQPLIPSFLDEKWTIIKETNRVKSLPNNFHKVAVMLKTFVSNYNKSLKEKK